MDIEMQRRADLFAKYVGLELKGRIAAQGFTAKAVAEKTGNYQATFSRWLNGKVELPLHVLMEACDVIGVEPRVVIDGAYARVSKEISRSERDVSSEESRESTGLVIVEPDFRFADQDVGAAERPR